MSLDPKARSEIDWWLTVWAPRIREQGYWEGHEILGPDQREIGTYQEQRRKEARARAMRMPVLVGLPADYLAGKVVVDIGPGAICALEMSGASAAYAVDPLANHYRDYGLLITGTTPVKYFAHGAERIPIPSASADVVVAFNSLDHVDDVDEVAKEIHRVLKPGGAFLLNVELDHAPTVAEPHSISEGTIETLFTGYRRDYYRVIEPDEAREELTHGSKWLMACLVRP